MLGGREFDKLGPQILMKARGPKTGPERVV